MVDRIQGRLTIGDRTFDYASGGRSRTRGNLPFGAYTVGSLRPSIKVGPSFALAGMDDVPDERYPNAPRSALLIHGAKGPATNVVDEVISAGCLAIPVDQYGEAKAAIIAAQQQYGDVVLVVSPEGAKIVPADSYTGDVYTPDGVQQFVADANAVTTQTPTEEASPEVNAQISQQADPELALMAHVMLNEARGEGREGMAAVGWVAQNRANDASGRWPTTITDVLNQEGQFDGLKLPANYTQEQFNKALDIAASVKAGVEPNPIGDAVYYWNPKTATDTAFTTKTAANEPFQGQVGNHVFYGSSGPKSPFSQVAGLAGKAGRGISDLISAFTTAPPTNPEALTTAAAQQTPVSVIPALAGESQETAPVIRAPAQLQPPITESIVGTRPNVPSSPAVVPVSYTPSTPAPRPPPALDKITPSVVGSRPALDQSGAATAAPPAAAPASYTPFTPSPDQSWAQYGQTKEAFADAEPVSYTPFDVPQTKSYTPYTPAPSAAAVDQPEADAPVAMPAAATAAPSANQAVGSPIQNILSAFTEAGDPISKFMSVQNEIGNALSAFNTKQAPPKPTITPKPTPAVVTRPKVVTQKPAAPKSPNNPILSAFTTPLTRMAAGMFGVDNPIIRNISFDPKSGGNKLPYFTGTNSSGIGIGGYTTPGGTSYSWPMSGFYVSPGGGLDAAAPGLTMYGGYNPSSVFSRPS